MSYNFWDTFILPHFSLATIIHLIALLCRIIGESQPSCVAVYTHELFSHEEMMGIKGNTQSIQNWKKLEPWTLCKN